MQIQVLFSALKNLMLIYTASVVLGCSTITRSISLGATTGAATGTLMGAAMVKQDKAKSSAKGALVTGIVGAIAGYFIHHLLAKRDEKARKELLFNLESFGITESKKGQTGANPMLTKPQVDSQWVETRIEGNKLIEAHRVWIIKENPKWLPKQPAKKGDD